jgi:hypothetical protein
VGLAGLAGLAGLSLLKNAINGNGWYRAGVFGWVWSFPRDQKGNFTDKSIGIFMAKMTGNVRAKAHRYMP